MKLFVLFTLISFAEPAEHSITLLSHPMTEAECRTLEKRMHDDLWDLYESKKRSVPPFGFKLACRIPGVDT